MKKGILGKKLGMTQVFTKSGQLIPVTVIEVEPNVVTQIKTVDTDGYDAIQLGFDTKREKLVNKPSIGHTTKANTTPKRFFREIRGVDASAYTLGQTITVEIFQEGEVIDVTGTSKGKGFQGSIKRHNFSRGPMTHGSHYHRKSGSMGSMRPMRVFKGKKLPGHMGVERVTIQNLEVVMVDIENNVLLVKGNVPGPKKGLVIVRTAIKNPDKINEFDGLNIYETENIEKTQEVAVETPEETTENTVETPEVAVETSEDAVETDKQQGGL